MGVGCWWTEETLGDIEGLKAKAQAAIDGRRDWLVDAAERVLRSPETGFREVATSRLVSEKLSELGVPHEDRLALTGVKGYVPGRAARADGRGDRRAGRLEGARPPSCRR